MLQLLIDGNNLAHRVHYTHFRLSANGQPTGVVYGGLQSIKRLRGRFPSARIIVCWDSRKNIRKEMFSWYKASRKTNSEKMKVIAQIPKLKRALALLAIASTSYTGFEADDIIAVLSKKTETIIVSNDTDLYQLLSGNVSIFKPSTETMFTDSDFRNEYGIAPKDWVLALALAGKGSNNIKGVKGVGLKTALRYLKGEKISNKLEGTIQKAIDNSFVVTDNAFTIELPLREIVPKITRCQKDLDEFKRLCTKYRFTSILKEFSNWVELFG